MQGWFPAVRWGVGAALASRLALLAWMAVVWLGFGERLGIPVDLHTDPVAALPTLEQPAQQAVFGVWRRWDASHYLNLAQNGYRAEDPGPTVFGLLTPLGIRAFDAALPGGIDLGAMVYATAAYAFALTMLYRVCEVYYDDADLGRWSVMVLAMLPLAFFFSAPMSEAAYLGLALGVFYAGAKGRWLLAGVFGALAALARSQGVMLAGVAGLMLLEAGLARCPTWPERLRDLARRGWPLLFIPAAWVGFLVFRDGLGLPPLDDIYRTRSYIFFTNPLNGLLLNLRYIVENPADALFNVDLWALVVSSVLFILLLRDRRHRRAPLAAYALASLLVAVSKINWAWGGYDDVLYSQSFGRYMLTVFPLAIWLADGLRRRSRPVRVAWFTLSGLGLVVFSALLALGGGAP
ncbi:MAG: hypothetical protein HXY41_13230 [Chloroflexi bacterium]|nr:hypothetical protein [Chloroflexota bacterium]